MSEDTHISVRVVALDYYLAPWVSALDGDPGFGGRATKHPVIRVFGPTSGGQKACVHVHGVLTVVLRAMMPTFRHRWSPPPQFLPCFFIDPTQCSSFPADLAPAACDSWMVSLRHSLETAVQVSFGDGSRRRPQPVLHSVRSRRAHAPLAHHARRVPPPSAANHHPRSKILRLPRGRDTIRAREPVQPASRLPRGRRPPVRGRHADALPAL